MSIYDLLAITAIGAGAIGFVLGVVTRLRSTIRMKGLSTSEILWENSERGIK